MNIKNLNNWHRYVLGAVMGFEAVCAAVLAGAVVVPPSLHDVAPFAGIAVVFLTIFIPTLQSTTGSGSDVRPLGPPRG